MGIGNVELDHAHVLMHDLGVKVEVDGAVMSDGRRARGDGEDNG